MCLSYLIYTVRPCLIHTFHAAPMPSPTMPFFSRPRHSMVVSKRFALISFKGFYLQKSQAVWFSHRENKIKIELQYSLNCGRYGGAEFRRNSDLEFMMPWRYFISTKQDIMTQFVGHKTTEINVKAGPQSLYVSDSSHFACLHHTLLKFRLDVSSPWSLHIRSTEIIKRVLTQTWFS